MENFVCKFIISCQQKWVIHNSSSIALKLGFQRRYGRGVESNHRHLRTSPVLILPLRTISFCDRDNFILQAILMRRGANECAAQRWALPILLYLSFRYSLQPHLLLGRAKPQNKNERPCLDSLITRGIFSKITSVTASVTYLIV